MPLCSQVRVSFSVASAFFSRLGAVPSLYYLCFPFFGILLCVCTCLARSLCSVPCWPGPRPCPGWGGVTDRLFWVGTRLDRRRVARGGCRRRLYRAGWLSPAVPAGWSGRAVPPAVP